MKLILLTLLFVTACATAPKPLPVFEKDKVCSSSSLEYYKNAPKMTKAGQQAAHKIMMSMQPHVIKCYNEEIARTKPQNFYVCMALGYDRKGRIEYFEMSNNTISVTPEFVTCLSRLQNLKSLRGPRNMKLLKSFKLEQLPVK